MPLDPQWVGIPVEQGGQVEVIVVLRSIPNCVGVLSLGQRGEKERSYLAFCQVSFSGLGA